jgi:hypothetical protein
VILFLHCEDRSAKYKSGNLVAVFPIRVTIRQQDMEPDGGGKRKGMNGGRSALARWRSALGVEQPSQRTERPAARIAKIAVASSNGQTSLLFASKRSETR